MLISYGVGEVVHIKDKTKRKGSRRRVMRSGADNPYKEFKIVTFYDQSNEYRQVVATAGNHQVLGRLVRRQAVHLGLNQFDQRLAIADGADWIYNQLAGESMGTNHCNLCVLVYNCRTYCNDAHVHREY